MTEEEKLFRKFFFEAPGDDDDAGGTDDATPDTPEDVSADAPNDTSIDNNTTSDDLGGNDDIDDTTGGDDAPPDIDDDGSDDDTGYDDSEEIAKENMHLNDKTSAILNVRLYQSFLNLITDISSHLTILEDNRDIFNSLSKDSTDIIPALKKLDDNIRIYLSDTFANERYEKNLLFFNKCLNLFKLLDDKFSDQISKGIKEYK